MSVNQYDPSTGTLRPVVGTNNHFKDEMVAPYEATTTASQAYAVGDQFIYNQTLYTTTAAIESGGTIVVGTNCSESDSLVDQIKDASGNEFNAGIVAPVEETTTATHAYAVGDQFIYNKGLYTATTAIAVGDTINSEEGWTDKTWNGFTSFSGGYIWTDGENIYYSYATEQYVLNKSTDTWETKTWNGLTDFSGHSIWTDGENSYYSSGSDQYVLDKTTSTWNPKTWNGLTSFHGDHIWIDGENIYYSYGAQYQYVLDKSTDTWEAKTWNGLTNFVGRYIWTDGENSYYSSGSDQYVLDKTTDTWEAKTWNGFDAIAGYYIWTDGENTYYSYGADQYVLDKSTDTWEAKTWNGLTGFSGNPIWTDGENTYYSYGAQYQYVLSGTNCTPSDPIVDQLGSGTSGNIITYAEWLQLTPEQQASGDYYIPDVPVNSSILPIAGFDNTPTENSINPVTSDGIYKALETRVSWEQQNVLGAKNLLPIITSSSAINGITVTVNSDKSITLNGTASADTDIPLLSARVRLETGKTYIASGCPVGSSATTYNMARNLAYSNGSGVSGLDAVNDVTFTVTDKEYFITWIRVKSGISLTNVTFKPMLRLASIADDTYVPYAPINRDCVSYAANTVLGAHNVLDNKATSQVNNGITFTVNDDKSVTANGTLTSTYAIFSIHEYTRDGNLTIPSGLYKGSGTPKTHTGNALIYINFYDGADQRDYGDGALFNYTQGSNYNISIIISGGVGKTVTNAKFYPMLTIPSDTDPTYVPYAKTNRELTKGLQNTILNTLQYKGVLTASDNLNSIEQGIYLVQGASVVNRPSDISGYWHIFNIQMGFYQQFILASNAMYFRYYGGSSVGWTSWIKVTGTVMS